MSFLSRNKNKSQPQIYQTGMVLPVLSAQSLLGKNRLNFLIDEVQRYCLLPEEYFDSFYRDLIIDFVEFVQLIPSHQNGLLGGLLNNSLVRAVIGLQRYTKHYGQESIDALECYAMFTACLLLDVAKVVTNQKVVVTDKKGGYITQWRPFVDSMMGLGDAYKLYSTASTYQRLDGSITPMLARQIMPEAGFLWLSSHWRIFADWLEALQGGGLQGGRLSNAIRRLRKENLKNEFKRIRVGEIDPLDIDGTDFGDEFYRWLEAGIEDGSISVNERNSHIHVVEEGVFVDKQLFKQYADLVNLPVNINVVFTQFGNAVGIVNRGGDYDFQFKQYFSDTPSDGKSVGFTTSLGQRGRSFSGAVVDDVRLLFKGKHAPTTSSYVVSAEPIKVNSPEIKFTIPGMAQRNR